MVFTLNATHALNLAIRSLVHPGDTVVISAWEHNAVTRTLASIPRSPCRWPKAPLFDDQETVAAFERALECRPAAVICTCVSNVFGYALPIRQIAAACRRAGIPLVLDASQAAGCMPISMKELGADYIAFPGHKGLYGPQGTGVLLCGGEEDTLFPVLTGGTGSESMKQEMPLFLPDRGRQVPTTWPELLDFWRGYALSGERRGPHRPSRTRLLKQLERGRTLDEVQCFAAASGNQTGVLSFRCHGMDCQSLAQLLGQQDIAGSGGGLHCAPLAHRSCRYTGHRYGPGELLRL